MTDQEKKYNGALGFFNLLEGRLSNLRLLVALEDDAIATNISGIETILAVNVDFQMSLAEDLVDNFNRISIEKLGDFNPSFDD